MTMINGKGVSIVPDNWEQEEAKKDMVKNDEYKEIFRLKEMLEKAKIPFEFRNIFNGYQICYPEANKKKEDCKCVCSVIEHDGSYGHEKDMLEIMGLLTDEEAKNDSVLGWLTAEDVFMRIEAHCRNIKIF